MGLSSERQKVFENTVSTTMLTASIPGLADKSLLPSIGIPETGAGLQKIMITRFYASISREPVGR
jgi:hypothetical protein